MIRILPILRFDRGIFGREIRIKYFLVQALGSALFLAGLLLSQIGGITRLIELALGLKLGAAPFHLWFIAVLRLTRLRSLFLLSTVQKVIPIRILNWLGGRIVISVLTILRSLVAGWGVFNHSNLRRVLAYSSIFSVAWCLARLGIFLWVWAAYLLVYGIGLWGLIATGLDLNSIRISHVYSGQRGIQFRLLLFLRLATLGGLPPLGRFWVKLLVLTNLLERGRLIIRRTLLLGSIWIVYAYIRVRFLSGRLGGLHMRWTRGLPRDGFALPTVLLVILPLLFMLPLVLLGGVTREILIFEILGKPKPGTWVY